ncbi:MAG TPA: porin family protein [Candidatus Nitrosocosmicus sp.]
MNSWFKTFAVLIFAIIFCKISYSQERFGIKAGVNFANKNVEGTSFDTKTGVNAGVMIQFPLGHRFFLHPELLYSVKGYKISNKVNLYYINLPIILGYKITSGFSVLIGPEAGYLENANTNPRTNAFNIYNFYRKFDIGIDAGAQYSLNKNFGIDIRYNYGFKDLEEVTITDPYGNYIDNKIIGANRVIELTLFYFFNKKKK